MTAEEYESTPRRLGKEEEESLIARLYTNSIEQRQRTLEELDRRYYPVAAPQRISEEQLKKSIDRQVDQEVELRRTRREEAEAAMQKHGFPVTNRRDSSKGQRADGAPLTLTQEEIDESVKRMYNDTLERKKANLEESKRRYDPGPAAAKRVPKEEMQGWISTASQPKKKEYSIAEVNRIYGLVPPEAPSA